MPLAETSPVTAHDRRMLALALTPQLGPTRLRRLLERVPDSDAIFRLSLTELEAAGLPAPSAQAIALGDSLKLAEAELKKLAALPDVSLVTLGSPLYPPPLAEIYDPPTVLYVRGDPRVLSRTGIAVIGTRHPTPYGLGMAERLSTDLAACGLVIFSGLARGIDSIAHKGAVAARARTVAVFGTGVDVIYPRENRKLAEDILAFGGALVSEFPTGTGPSPHNFPLRNRVLSGMARGVLVIEAGEHSGTRITARCALEQCREVYAVPGNVTNKQAFTPNFLIKQGAKLVATWEDVYEELPTSIRLELEAERKTLPEPRTASLFDAPPMPELAEEQRKLYAVIQADQSTHIDELIEHFEGELTSAEIFNALFELEMANRIRQLPGKNYVRVF